MKRTFKITSICLCTIIASACGAGAESAISTTADAASASSVNCAAGQGALSTVQTPAQAVEPTLTYLQDFEQDVYGLQLGRAFTLSGKCAPLVEAALMVNNIIGLSNGDVYQITTSGIAPWPLAYSRMFQRADLSQSEIPDIPNAQFVHAVRVERGERYVGLWKQKGDGLIVDFTVPAGSGQAADIRPLLRSSLPLRSVSYFPAPDTRSGGLYLVQETPSGVRVIAFNWWHSE